MDRRNQSYSTFLESSASLSTKDDDQTFSVQEAIDRLGFGRYQIKISIFAGLCFMADSMEIMLLSILAPVLKCTFNLNGTEEALLTVVVFVGMACTSNIWGLLSDKYGRRNILIFSASLASYFGILTAVSPSYIWILINRFLVGCTLGATPQSVTFYSEFLPKQHRGACLTGLAILWAIGSCLEILLALLLMPSLGWRWVVVTSTVPLLIFVCSYKFFPESPYFYLAHGQDDKALAILQAIAKSNRRSFLKGSLLGPNDENVQAGQIKDLFVPAYRKTTILLTIMWMSGNTSYYGTALLNTSLFENADGCHGYDSSTVIKEDNCDVFCKTMTESDYIDLLITTAGEAPGVFICMALFTKIGRKKVIALLLFVYTLVMALCNICAPRVVLVVLLFIARGVINGAAQGVYTYTAEVFPASVRGTGLGWCASATRVGVIATPFVASVLIQISTFLPISIYAILGLCGTIAVLLLPIETKDRDLKVTTREMIG